MAALHRRPFGVFQGAAPLLVTTFGLVVAACGARDGLPGIGGTGGARACASRTFAPETSYAVGALPNAVAVGDFNEDGHLDLVVTNGANGAGSTGRDLILSGRFFVRGKAPAAHLRVSADTGQSL